MNYIVINGKQHELTSAEITLLQHYISCMYVDDILEFDFLSNNPVMNSDTLMQTEEYKKYSELAKAGVSLYHYLCEELDKI